MSLKIREAIEDGLVTTAPHHITRTKSRVPPAGNLVALKSALRRLKFDDRIAEFYARLWQRGRPLRIGVQSCDRLQDTSLADVVRARRVIERQVSDYATRARLGKAA